MTSHAAAAFAGGVVGAYAYHALNSRRERAAKEDDLATAVKSVQLALEQAEQRSQKQERTESAQLADAVAAADAAPKSGAPVAI